MAYNSRVQMDTTGSGSLSGGRVLDKLTRIDKNMALIQKDIRTLVRKSASDRAGSFFANEDARESSMEGSRVKRGGSKGFSFSRDVKAGAKKGEGMMNALFGGIVTGLLGGLLGVMGKVIGGVAVLGYKLVSKLVASIAAAYGITSMGGAIEKGKPSWMKKTDAATPTSTTPQTPAKPTSPAPPRMTADEMRKYQANRAANMPAAEAQKQALGFKGMSRSADSMAAKKATAAAAEGAAGGVAKGGIKGALTQALPVLGKIGGKLSVGLLKTIPFIGPVISLIFDFFEGGAMAESLGVSKASGIMGTILGGAEGGIMNSFMNAGKWAMLGAAIGSVVPVVGTILGGVVGAILGGIMGYFGGDVIAEKIDAVFTDIGRFVEDSFNGLKDIGTYLGTQIVNLISQMMAMVKVGAGNMILGAAKLMEKVPGLGGAAKSLTAMGNDLVSSGNKDSADATAAKDAELKASKDASSKRDTNIATTREGEDAATVVRQANNEEKKKAAESTPGVGAMVADQVAAAKPPGAAGGSFPTGTSPQQAGAPAASGSPIAGGDINAVGATPSKSLLEMIKAKEGFSAKAFWDHKQWSIGYGTQAKDGSEVISKEEAEKRLSADVEKRKAYVLTFGKKNGYNWGEQQVDALTSFIYNLGYGALDSVTGKGKRSNEEIAKKMLEYNKASGKVNTGLAKRRGEETALFSGGAAGGGSPQMAAAGGGSTATLPTSQVGAMNSTAQGGSFPTGAAVSSASSAVSDGRMDLASAPPVVNVTAPSPPSSSSKGSGGTGSASADVYDRDITKLLVGRAFSFS
jgi:GH24 family phage-related lysozyme (muramidase)